MSVGYSGVAPNLHFPHLHRTQIYKTKSLKCQDTADGEFAVVKTALNNNLLRADSSADGYCEVKTSKQIVDFGNRHLGTPRAGADLRKRIFCDLPPDTVLRRKELDKEDPLNSKTVSGISNIYEIICQVSKTDNYKNSGLPSQADGNVLWRRFPCFCPPCQYNQWQDCQNKDIVGKVENVKV